MSVAANPQGPRPARRTTIDGAERSAQRGRSRSPSPSPKPRSSVRWRRYRSSSSSTGSSGARGDGCRTTPSARKWRSLGRNALIERNCWQAARRVRTNRSRWLASKSFRSAPSRLTRGSIAPATASARERRPTYSPVGQVRQQTQPQIEQVGPGRERETDQLTQKQLPFFARRGICTIRQARRDYADPIAAILAHSRILLPSRHNPEAGTIDQAPLDGKYPR
ncbi:hypothetical protein MJ8_14170 [Mesorhizobium sp. J8]|nr:hypothetical protein MJ8_14170 [Mesorhizobium sp. J8]